MELQCKERVDLLETLKQSRQEASAGDEAGSTPASGRKLSKTPATTPRESSESERVEKGWIGGGTIPAVSIPEIARPPPLPQRPAMAPKNSSEQAVVGHRNLSSTSGITPSSQRTYTPNGPTLAPPGKKQSRSPSPDKGRSMRTTLRSGGKDEKKTTMRSRPPGPKAEAPVPSKAATLAWNSMGRTGRDRLGRSLDEASSSNATLDGLRKNSYSSPSAERPGSSTLDVHYDSTTRRLVNGPPRGEDHIDLISGKSELYSGRNNSYPFPPTDPGQPGAVAGQMLTPSAVADLIDLDPLTTYDDADTSRSRAKGHHFPSMPTPSVSAHKSFEPASYPTYLKEYPETTARKAQAEAAIPLRRRSPVKANTPAQDKKLSRRPITTANSSSPRSRDRHMDRDDARRAERRAAKKPKDEDLSSQSPSYDTNGSDEEVVRPKRRPHKQKQKEEPILADPTTPISDDSDTPENLAKNAWDKKVADLMKNLPRGVDDGAAKQIFNEIVVQGDEVHWDDVAGLEVAKNALKEAVVYPFLRPDLFMGLREPARGMLLFGPPGTGKTMLARAVATESRSTFFSISASSLTSKYLGESEKLVRALFSLAKALAPSIIFVDEIDSLLSSRSGSGENEATRRIKTEFLIQWSDLARAAAGREQTEKEKERGDASRVLVLAATNLPWAIDEAARRRFVRRQYIPLPEDQTRALQMRTLLGHQKHSLDEEDIQKLVALTDGKFPWPVFNGITKQLSQVSRDQISRLWPKMQPWVLFVP